MHQYEIKYYDWFKTVEDIIEPCQFVLFSTHRSIPPAHLIYVCPLY